MPLLPPLRWGGHRWWLPVTARSATTLANHMLQFSGGASAGDSCTYSTLCSSCLRHDAGLLIWTSLSWVAEDSSRLGASATLDQLAGWLQRHLVERLIASDGVEAPRADAAARGRWSRLAESADAMPLNERLCRAASWLEVLGPPVPAAWQSGWPQLAESSDAGPRPRPASATGDCSAIWYPDPAIDLRHVAWTAARCRQLSERFETLLQSEKSAALKELAYGLSHEINNPLANISARAQQLLRDEKQPDRRRTLEQVDAQAMRAFEMIADLMFVARPSPPQPSRFWLAELVDDVLASRRQEAQQQSIELRLATAESVALEVLADRDQIHECCDALLRNAIDAVGQDGRIDVVIDVEGGDAIIAIADDGPGVSERGRQHAFDPYYSGREAGRGLGMGLARARVLAEQNGGSIALAASPPGCVARMRIPRADRQEHGG